MYQAVNVVKMKNILLLFGLILISFLIAGCDKIQADNELLMKVKNSSLYNFQQVFINTSGGEHLYGEIPANSESEYKLFEYAYRYAYIEVVIEGEKYTIQPIDYVGEKRLEPGRYTFVLNVEDDLDEYKRLSMKLDEK